MDNRPPLDRELLVPIFIGGFSLIGIIVALMIGRSMNAPAEVAMTPSATPFQYVYLGTEPAISTPLVEGSEGAPTREPAEGAFPTDALSGASTPLFFTPTRSSSALSTPTSPLFGSTPTRASSVSTPLILATAPAGTVVRTSTSTGGPTSTATNATAAASNTYDDTDPRLSYSPGWAPQTGVAGAYQETLHLSTANGNSVSFTFTGQEIHLFYQPGTSLGIVTITFDTDPLGTTLNEAQGGGEWVKMLDSAGTHTVTITHTSGGSVNIDRLVIPALAPTPTRTSTPNQ